MNIHNPLRQFWPVLRFAVAPFIIVLVTASLGFMFRVRGERVTGQQLRELLENASWYSLKNSTVHLNAIAVRGGIEIKIQDRGYGIPAADFPRIFEQFKRGSNAMRYKPAGNGLGLYIVKRIVQRSRGRITLTSELGTGTTVTLFLRQAV